MDGPKGQAWMSVTDGYARNNTGQFEENARNQHLYNKSREKDH